MNHGQFIASFFIFTTRLGLPDWWVALGSQVARSNRFVKHCRLVLDVQVTSFKVSAVVLENNWMVDWTVVSQTHLLNLVCVVPEHVAVVSNESSVVVKMLVNNLLLFIQRFIHIENWFGSGHSHRWPSKIFRISLVTLVTNEAVWVHCEWRLNLFLQLGHWIDIKTLFWNTLLGSNDFAIDIKWFHIVTKIDLWVLHFSQLTLGLVSISRRISLVDCNFRVWFPNAICCIINKFDCRRLYVIWFWFRVLSRFSSLHDFWIIVTLGNIFRCTGNSLSFAHRS